MVIVIFITFTRPEAFSLSRMITLYAVCNDISHDKRCVPLYQYFSKHVWSGKYGCILKFFDFVLSGYVAQVLCE